MKRRPGKHSFWHRIIKPMTTTPKTTKTYIDIAREWIENLGPANPVYDNGWILSFAAHLDSLPSHEERSQEVMWETIADFGPKGVPVKKLVEELEKPCDHVEKEKNCPHLCKEKQVCTCSGPVIQYIVDGCPVHPFPEEKPVCSCGGKFTGPRAIHSKERCEKPVEKELDSRCKRDATGTCTGEHHMIPDTKSVCEACLPHGCASSDGKCHCVHTCKPTEPMKRIEPLDLRIVAIEYPDEEIPNDAGRSVADSINPVIEKLNEVIDRLNNLTL